MLPGDIAGVVMGMGVRAPCNKYALSVSFGSEGFSPALARVFNHVSVLWAYRVFKWLTKRKHYSVVQCSTAIDPLSIAIYI